MLIEEKFQNQVNHAAILVKGHFQEDEPLENLVQEKNTLTYFFDNAKASIYLGSKETFTRKAFSLVIKKLVKENYYLYQLDLATFANEHNSLLTLIYDFVISSGYYQHKLFSLKTTVQKFSYSENDLSVYLAKMPPAMSHILEGAKVQIEEQNWARDLQNTPPNIANSEWLAKEYVKHFQGLENVEVKVLGREELKALGMNLLLAVNAGSVYEPRFVVASYKGAPESEHTSALIGKGITYDAGGYSIKIRNAMRYMKYDMSGSAIVMAALSACARLKAHKNIVALAPITDNRLNGNANLPDNVIISMSGKAVEISNTDAEGRLILADGIAYAQQVLKVQEIIDISTLTGAMKSTLGKTYVGAWSNNDQNFARLNNVAQRVNERVWRMPFHRDFLAPLLKTQIADIINSSMLRQAGSSTAAMFLKFFVNPKTEYLHLDIAATARDGNDFTAPMVRTLSQYFAGK